VPAIIAGIAWEYLVRPVHFPDSQSLGQQLLSISTVCVLCVNVPLVWFNLLPIPPLDGGQIAMEFVGWIKSWNRPGWEQDADWWRRR
jgi:Zn-dependent protease